MLFALNERYDPATKRVEEVHREFKILPPGFLSRYRTILETPLTPEGRKTIVKELRAVLNEVDSLAANSK
jgi:hypothetical protein